jgi:HEAT repeat protein
MVARSAINAVGQIGDISNLEPLADLMIARESAPLSREALNAMVEVMRRSTEPAEAVSILVARMDGTSPRSQVNLLRALALTGSDEALKPLAEACRSDDEQLQKQAIKLMGEWKTDNGIPVMLELASDDALSMGSHVTLMRGVSRLLAAQKPRYFDKEQAYLAVEICRRAEERDAIQATIDKAR